MLIRRDEHNIDKAFRQGLYDAQEQPPAHLWEGIRNNSGGRKRIAAFWFVPLLMLVVAGACGYYFSNRKELAQAEFNTGTKHQATGDFAVNKADADLSGAINEAQNELAAGYRKQEPVYKAVDSNKSIDVATKIRTTAKQKYVSISKVSNEELQQVSLIDESREQLQANEMTLSVANKDSRTDDAFVVDVLQTTGEAWGHIKANSENAAHVISEQLAIDTVLMSDAQLDLPVSSGYPQPRIPCSSQFAVGLYVTTFFPERQYAHSPSPSSNAVQSDITMEVPALTTGFGIGAGVVWQPKHFLYAMTGVELTNFKEDHRWNDYFTQTEVLYEGYYQDTTYKYVDNDTLLSIAQVPIPVDTAVAAYSQQRNQRNSYSAIQVPVLLGISWQHNRWTVGAEGGVMLKVQRNFSGYYYRDDVIVNGTETTDIPPLVAANAYIMEGEEVSTQQYYNSWKLDYHLGLRMAYSFNQHWQIAAGAHYRWMHFDARNDFVPAHTLRTPGINLGFFYKL
ncbi:MAG: hypothetical protein ACKVOR_14225 [Flavobacteriales bacterium]